MSGTHAHTKRSAANRAAWRDGGGCGRRWSSSPSSGWSSAAPLEGQHRSGGHSRPRARRPSQTASTRAPDHRLGRPRPTGRPGYPVDATVTVQFSAPLSRPLTDADPDARRAPAPGRR